MSPLTDSFRNFDYVIHQVGFELKQVCFPWFRRLVDSDNGIGRMFKSTNYHCANLCRRFCTRRRFHFRSMLVTVTRTNWHYENQDCQSTRCVNSAMDLGMDREPISFFFFSSMRNKFLPLLSDAKINVERENYSSTIKPVNLKLGNLGFR